MIDHVNDLNTDTPKVKSDLNGVSPDLVFGLDTQLFSVAYNKTHSLDEMVFDPKHQENEVDLIQVIQHVHEAASCLSKEQLVSFLQTMPKEDIYRIKGFIRLGDSSRLHILNHAFGRHTLTEVEHEETLEEAKDVQVKITVMGQDLRMYFEKVKNGLLQGGQGEAKIIPAHRHDH